MRKDRRELNNVHVHPGYTDVQKRMKRKLQTLKGTYEVPEDMTEADPSWYRWLFLWGMLLRCSRDLGGLRYARGLGGP